MSRQLRKSSEDNYQKGINQEKDHSEDKNDRKIRKEIFTDQGPYEY